MSILFADGFEHYGNGSGAKPNLLAGVYAQILRDADLDVSENHARTGSRSLRSATNAAITLPLPGAGKSFVGVCLGVWMDNLPPSDRSGRIGISFRRQNNASAITLCYAADGSIIVKQGDIVTGAIIGQTDAGVLTASAFNHIEAQFGFDPVGGSCAIRVNGVEELVLSGINTLGTVTLFELGTLYYDGNSSGVTAYYDDLVIYDNTGDNNNTWLGQVRVLTVFPTSDVAPNDFDATGATSRWDAVNETTPDGDTSYIAANDIGDKQRFGFSALPPETTKVVAVYVPTLCKVSAAGAGGLQLSVNDGTDRIEGPELSLSTAYTYRPSVFNHSPDGGAWSKSKFEAMKLELEKIEIV